MAIERLHANGHRAFLCTGRSRAFVPPYIEELGLDGIIAGISTYIELGGKCLFNRETRRKRRCALCVCCGRTA